MFDPIIPNSAAVLMQNLLLAARHGYRYWVGGEVPCDRAMELAAKFADLYACDRTTKQRYLRTQSGRANSRLFLYPIADSMAFGWFLLCTDPTRFKHGDRECWRDSKSPSTRLLWKDQYELVRLSDTKQFARKYRASDIRRVDDLTWRMTHDFHESWRARIRHAIAAEKRGNDALITQAIYALETASGFRGIRTDVSALREYAKRSRRAAGFAEQRFESAPICVGSQRGSGSRLSDILNWR